MQQSVVAPKVMHKDYRKTTHMLAFKISTISLHDVFLKFDI